MSDPAATRSATLSPLWRALTARIPESWLSALATRPFVILLLDSGALLAAFVIVDRLVERFTRLPEAAYREPVLALELALRLGPAMLIAAGIGAFVLLRYGRVWSAWQDIDGGTLLRGFVMPLVVAMGWTFSSYDYNYFFDQAHMVDRLAIIALVPLIWWRPVFVLPFVLMVYTVMYQVAEPGLGGSVFAHKLQVLRVLNLFAAAFVIHALTGRRRLGALVLLTSSLIAGAYWEAALAKIELDWWSYGHLYRLPLAAYPHGWLAFLPAADIVSLSASLRGVDWLMRTAVLVAETSCLFFLARRGLSLALLGAVIVFHLGVFAFYGFCFWTWILVDLSLLVLLWRDRTAETLISYRWPQFVLSVVLIATAGYWARPPHLGWYDTTLTYTYRLEATDAQGSRSWLPPAWFGPYRDNFTMMAFSYLSDHGNLVAPYGVTHDRAIAEALNRPLTPETIFEMETTLGTDRHNDARAAEFTGFVRDYVSHRNARGPVVSLPFWLKVPPQFFSFNAGTGPGAAPVSAVTVVEITTALIDGALVEIRRTEVATIPIPHVSN